MRTRLTKQAVLDEIVALRKRIAEVCRMDEGEMVAEYHTCFPQGGQNISVGEARRAVLVAATYHLTNILGLE